MVSKKRDSMTVMCIALLIQVAYAVQGNDTLPAPPYDGIALLHEGEFTPTPKDLVAKDNATRISGQNVPYAARETAISHAPPFLGESLWHKEKFTPPGPNPEAPAAKNNITGSSGQNMPQPPLPYPGPTVSSEGLEN